MRIQSLRRLKARKTHFLHSKRLDFVNDIAKVFEIFSKHFHTSLVQDFMFGYAKKTNVKIVCLFALKMVVLSIFDKDMALGL